ncbi:hypothetical protein Kpol_1023p102 [Vanderwaltozyma polyspora DSM 70294]|uniref:Vacuolar protein sorting-associated protein 70 n=1 Tax=Vanderwaltozyma polyspora (strain ATCC 22028 / DSM 70294 / BCRC 21397 / CBS 2163 / NBRC 10782 / NRRL Y-8283 / UCD 57-17) TaxID=436907 RepID=A7TFX0_VANPO|nr:uncharacterized protein Kpol_1023p102 [Vanderwaltozyma polyspora DSM 70294]EDO18928.1 hypothetical protein Kpol_1023p102 [Vanderwaltozyma polyspora DSM 70294]
MTADECITDDESQPLLWENGEVLEEQNSIHESIVESIRRQRTNTITSIRSGYQLVKEHVDKEKFIYLICLSLFLYLSFMAVFAPRSSLSMDFRWLHGSRLTEAEVYRLFINKLDEVNLIKTHIGKLSDGSKRPGDQSELTYVTEQLEKLGFNPKLEKYYPWMSTPNDTKLQLYYNDNIKYNFGLIEDCLEDYDQLTCIDNKLKGFHTYSANGEVKSSYVFVNYGTLQDYKLLLDNNISVEGKIHIIRNGDITQGFQLKNAELYGAIGVVTFSDPVDDGFVTNENGFASYPYGKARHLSSINRGSVAYLADIPGDPTSPNFPSKNRDTERLSPAGKIPTIPSLPLSSEEVSNLLAELNGIGYKFQEGGDVIGFDYSSGPSPENVTLLLSNSQNYNITEITNIVIDIKGIFSEGMIILGSHRDHWTVGGVGKSSSNTALFLEIARGMSYLISKGWKPLRPIKLVNWDGSEEGFLGSTEYGEDHAAFFRTNAISYINMDNIMSGTKFSCLSNPLLKEVIIKASRSTSFKGLDDWTLYDEWKRQSPSTEVDYPGGDSDTMIFQNHLGIPSMECSFINDRLHDAVYQPGSNFDTEKWMETFLDPRYELHSTLATFFGLVVLNLSEKVVIPFKSEPYFQTIHRTFSRFYSMIVEEFPHDKEIYTILTKTSELISRFLETESISLDDYTKKVHDEAVQELPLWQAYKKFGMYARLLRTNSKLMKFDKLFLSHCGLNNREWMKHSIFAPDKYNGFEGIILPGIKEALQENNRDELRNWLTILYVQLTNLSLLIR